jgi:hypothetical protein
LLSGYQADATAAYTQQLALGFVNACIKARAFAAEAFELKSNSAEMS